MELAEYNKLPYPRNLWSVVFKKTVREKNLPSDWNETLSYLFDSLNDSKKVDILLRYFKDRQTLFQISRFYKSSYSPIRQHLERSILMLQHPSRIHIMEVGIKRATHMQENKIGYWSDARPFCEDGNLANTLVLPIDVLDLSGRPYNCLRRMGIDTIGQLISHSKRELLMFRAMGPGSVDEITRSLDKRQLTLREDSDPIC